MVIRRNLDQYKIAGSREIRSDSDVQLVQSYIGQSLDGCLGHRRSGRDHTSAAAAIGNAFHNATGVRIRSTPDDAGRGARRR